MEDLGIVICRYFRYLEDLGFGEGFGVLSGVGLWDVWRIEWRNVDLGLRGWDLGYFGDYMGICDLLGLNHVMGDLRCMGTEGLGGGIGWRRRNWDIWRVGFGYV